MLSSAICLHLKEAMYTTEKWQHYLQGGTTCKTPYRKSYRYILYRQNVLHIVYTVNKSTLPGKRLLHKHELHMDAKF
jgi:hypothetical protein